MTRHKALGFTLAELLSALAILGIIATFTIPKVLSSSTNGQMKAMGKEFAATISAAYQAYSLENAVSSTTGWVDLTPYINYVNIETTGTVSVNPCEVPADYDCDASYPCIKLHGGAKVSYGVSDRFNGTTNKHSLRLWFDPNGTSSGAKDSLILYLYTDGKIRTTETVETSTLTFQTSGGASSFNPMASCDPTWFGWD